MATSHCKANLDRLCENLQAYASTNSIACATEPSSAASRLADSLFLANSATDANFAAICETGHLISASRLATSRGQALSPDCTEVIMGTSDSVFFYLSQFRFPGTTCGLLFTRDLEVTHESVGVATPFDSGGLVEHLNRPDSAISLRDFLSSHEMPIPEHRRYLGLSMDALFDRPADYLTVSAPKWPGPIGLTGGDQRRWTHEVRIPDSVLVRSDYLQAAFAPRARLADPDIENLFQWCAAEGVDRIMIGTAKGDDFEELQRQCLVYIQEKLQ